VGEAEIKDQAGGRDFQGQVNGHGASQRSSEKDHSGRGHWAIAEQTPPGRQGILIEALLRKCPAALSIAPVVKGKDTDSPFQEQGNIFQAMADIAGVAVAPG